MDQEEEENVEEIEETSKRRTIGDRCENACHKSCTGKEEGSCRSKNKSFELSISFKKHFDMTFKFLYMLLEHMDHGQKLASVELLIIGVHRRHVHIKIVGSNSDILK